MFIQIKKNNSSIWSVAREVHMLLLYEMIFEKQNGWRFGKHHAITECPGP